VIDNKITFLHLREYLKITIFCVEKYIKKLLGIPGYILKRVLLIWGCDL